MAKADWIKGAIKNKGSLTRKAKAAGQSVSQYERSTKNKSAATKRQIQLAMTLNKFRKKSGT